MLGASGKPKEKLGEETSLTKTQFEILMHAVGGLPASKGYRNSYCATSWNQDAKRLESLGLMQCLQKDRELHYYSVTQAGYEFIGLGD